MNAQRPLFALLAASTLLTAFAAADPAQAQHALPETAGQTLPAVDLTAPVDPLGSVQTRWAEIRYRLPEDQRVAAFERLLGDIDIALNAAPEDLRLKVWRGIVLASEAGATGGLGALSLVKQARAEFEAVIEKDGRVLDGSAYTSLGSLYYQVPGWPIGFGDDDKAAELLKQGLSIAPEGIDANYFYGDYLLDQDDYAGAVAAFEKALAAPMRVGRESADAGRRSEIEAALVKARSALRNG